MKGQINESGRLFIERGNFGFIQMDCKLSGNHSPCDHNCPLFGEPEPVIKVLSDYWSRFKKDHPDEFETLKNSMEIELCQEKILRFTELDDQRGKD